ncbi:MAG TPA: hypothetical protein VE864_07905, partial [Streptosporangiaceae bacterium]|nr:hypothetical protein [Streptosporangiaceae bacterium]
DFVIKRSYLTERIHLMALRKTPIRSGRLTNADTEAARQPRLLKRVRSGFNSGLNVCWVKGANEI